MGAGIFFKGGAVMIMGWLHFTGGLSPRGTPPLPPSPGYNTVQDIVIRYLAVLLVCTIGTNISNPKFWENPTPPARQSLKPVKCTKRFLPNKHQPGQLNCYCTVKSLAFM